MIVSTSNYSTLSLRTPDSLHVLIDDIKRE